MNPPDPDALPEGVNPADPTDAKPWHKQPPTQPDAVGSTGGDDGGSGTGEVLEGVGATLDCATGCLGGCGSCSLAILVALMLAGSAFAMFR